MSDFKNESLFHPRISETEARATVAYALRMGWAQLPAPSATIPRAPANKKRVTRLDGTPQPSPRIAIEACVPSDVPPPQ